MKIEDRNIDTIQPYEKNAKKHPQKQVMQIADSIKEFGLNQPIVVDKKGVIIVGHGRYLAAKALNLTKVPCLVANLTDEQARAYRLADNKLNESDWEMDLVLEELKNLSLEMVDLTGFDSDLILETQEDDISGISLADNPKSKEGDVYELGPHILICGDSEKEETYYKLLGDEKARLIFTDPPYSVNYESQTGKSYNSDVYGGTGGRIFNDDKSPEEAVLFYTRILERLYQFSTKDVSLYWWYANSIFPENLKAWKDTGWHYSQTIFWLKEHFVFSMGQLYHRIYEPCMVGWKKGNACYKDGAFSNISEFWTLGKKTFQDHIDAWFEKRDATNDYIHPTQKPVRLAERAIKRSSEKDDVVLDAFGGSGSTLIACDQLERRARLIELDPKFVDAIVNRWCLYKEVDEVIKNGKLITWEVKKKKNKKTPSITEPED